MTPHNAAALDTAEMGSGLLHAGYELLPELLEPSHCAMLREYFDDDRLFRSRVVMEKHGFGQGEYKYFKYPLPQLVQELRSEFYERLLPIANHWNELLGRKERFPASQQLFQELCEESDQSRPTALLLRYREGDYNCLHEDRYGEVAFPFQMTVFLTPNAEYDGGEFVLIEQRPRQQSRPIVLRPNAGDALIFPNRYRPVKGRSGYYRTTFRHGVSEIRRGERFTLGIIFHDAK